MVMSTKIHFITHVHMYTLFEENDRPVNFPTYIDNYPSMMILSHVLHLEDIMMKALPQGLTGGGSLCSDGYSAASD